MAKTLKMKQVHELLYQALETEKGGIAVYETALRCAQHDELKKEWEKYLEQTQNHEQIVLKLFEAFELDPATETPGRQVVRHIGESLVGDGDGARGGRPEAAQIVAAECVVRPKRRTTSTGSCSARSRRRPRATGARGAQGRPEEVEEQEDEHLYHTTGWTRELWIASLGLPAVLPPPEEEKEVKTAIGAARAKMARKEML